MAFTEPWDLAFPPDTQLAKLGAQDFRETKSAITERMAAFAVGILVNRPTPEAEFGAANNGVLYYAEDVGVLYRWDGAAWLDVRYDFTLADITPIAVVAPAETPGNLVTFPAGSLKAGAKITVFATANSDTAGSANLFRLYVQNIAPIFTLGWNDKQSVVIRAEILINQDIGYKGLFQGFIGDNVTQTFGCPDEQGFDVLSACGIGTSLEVSVGTGLLTGLSAKISL